MMDISEILEDPDFQVELEIERRTETVDEAGRGHMQASRSAIIACIQPLTPDELERLPEADRDRESLAVWSASLLQGTGPNHAPDLIIWQGKTYEVTGVEKWPGWWRAVIQLLPEGENEYQP